MPQIKPMTMDHYDSVLGLWENSPGVVLRAVDSRSSVDRYLRRNPDLSAVATLDNEVVGCLLCGHDGRRGYLQHLTVAPQVQRRGIGSALVGHCLRRLALTGIDKVHAEVLVGNLPAQGFWEKRRWMRRADIVRYSHIQTSDPNA